MSKQRSLRNRPVRARTEVGKATAGLGRNRGRRNTRSGGFSFAKAIWRVETEHLTDLAQDVSALIGSTSGDPGARNRIKALLSSLAVDSRYSAITPVFGRIQERVDAGDWVGARNLAVEVFNGTWERSNEYDVGRDAFLRRIRGKDFKPLSYRDPLISDRGAALAVIMQSDKEKLDTIIGESPKRNELVIELTGEFDLIRLMKD